MPESADWVKTPVAVQKTGRSRSQLLRLVKAGWLNRGHHWLKGPTPGSPYTWNIAAINEVLSQQAAMPTPGNTDPESDV